MSSPPIERVLFSCQTVHVYQIPPLTSTRGFSASAWTAPPAPTARQIFTARLRIVERSTDVHIVTSILLEDARTGDLFAEAPYTAPAVVQQASDSSRFFAVRVQGDGGMKATLGIGFGERSEAFDFSIALAETRKVLGMEGSSAHATGSAKKDLEEPKKADFTLKEGEMLRIEVGGKGRRVRREERKVDGEEDGAALYSIRPPPGSGTMPSLPPPPSTGQAKAKQQPQPSAQDLGFDDGEFGEFQ
ncbi:hypothetical protein LTR66_002260 [Elasticomyces elasticus]|nr:hypothetical protein LTR66_002260 [Elasticomyces elasticus]